MENEGMKTILMLVIVAVVLVTLTFAVKAILTMQDGSQYQPKLTGSAASNIEQPTAPNIGSSQPTPSSCTASQNCGSPTCAAAQGTGGCGCGG